MSKLSQLFSRGAKLLGVRNFSYNKMKQPEQDLLSKIESQSSKVKDADKPASEDDRIVKIFIIWGIGSILGASISQFGKAECGDYDSDLGARQEGDSSAVLGEASDITTLDSCGT